MKRDKLAPSRTQLLRNTQVIQVVQDEKPVKKKFDFKEFVDSFNSLDPENIGNWPVPVKATIVVFVFLLTLFLGYMLLIKPILSEIEAAEAQEETSLNTFREKESKVRNLKQYQKQIEDMNQTFDQLLSHLPKKTEISGLVEDINVTGLNSNVKIKDIQVKPETPNDMFYELPIEVKATGQYHNFGEFVSGISDLPRIVTVGDFDISSDDTANGVQWGNLSLFLHLKTYRLNDTASANKTDDKKKGP